MYYATGMPGWMRYGCPGSAAFPVGGFQGVSQQSRYADDVQGMSAEREKELLGRQAQFLRSELEIVEQRLNELAGLGMGSAQSTERTVGQSPEQSSEQSPDQGQGSMEGGE